jgi:two-component system phosphate regulon sensor histidine kinase PhoR
MNRRLTLQLPGVAAALAAVFGLGLANAPLWLQLAAGLGAGIGVGWLWPWRAPAPREAARPAVPAPMASGAERHVLERLPTPLVMIDRQGAVTFANPPARALFERLATGAHYSQTFRHPDLLSAIAEAMETGAHREFDFTRRSDATRHLRAHVHGAPAEPGDDRPRVICLFLRGPARDDAAAREEFLGVMAGQADRMQRLVDDLLSLSSIEMNQHQPPETPVRLAEIVTEVAKSLAPVAEARGAEIVVEAPPDALVLGDRDQLSQALGNLVENALKYGRKGAPVRIAGAAANPSFPSMVGVAVIDQGEGVAREHIPRLTERFYRVSPKRSRDLGGTGLGLAIVKHIAARHRGELEIRSEPGVGSRFTLWLPEAPEASGG